VRTPPSRLICSALPLLRVGHIYGISMRCEVVNGVVTFLAHVHVRQVSEAQVARSPHLARLRLLPGIAELPIRPDAFLVWQDLVEEDRDAEEMSLETACEVFEARFLRLDMCRDNAIAMTQLNSALPARLYSAFWEADACA
jgi:hypothetical protein